MDQTSVDAAIADIEAECVIDTGLGASLGAAPVPAERVRRFARLLSQTSPQERASLYAVTRHGYSGEGAVLDIGVAAGGSSFCLAAGLLDAIDAAGGEATRHDGASTPRPGQRVHCFDLFDGYSLLGFEPELRELDLSFASDLELFAWQTEAVSRAVEAHRQDLAEGSGLMADLPKVEIAHIDAAKTLELWRTIFSALCDSVIPGRTIWIFQDFDCAELPWQVWALGELLVCGSFIGGARVGTMYFRFDAPIPEAVKAKIRDNDFTLAEMTTNIERVIDRVGADHAHLFEASGTLEDNRIGLLAHTHRWVGDHDRALELQRRMTPAFRDSRPEHARDLLMEAAWAWTAADRLDDALDAVGRVLDQEPDHVPALVLVAQIRLAQKRYDEAITACREVLARDLADDTAEAVTITTCLVMANAQWPAGQYGAAIASAERVLAIEPDHLGALLVVAQVRLAQGEVDAAAAAARRVLEVDPRHEDAAGIQRLASTMRADALMMLARSHLARGDHAEVIATTRQVLDLRPDHTDALMMLARSHVALGDHAEVIATTRQVLDLRPDDVDALMMLARSHVALDDQSAVIETTSRILQLRPDDIDALMMQAYALVARDEYDEAVAVADQVVRAQPSHLDALTLIAQSRLVQGDRDGALRAARRVLDQDPDHVTALILVAQTSLERRDFDAAVTAVDRLEARLPDIDDAATRGRVEACRAQVRGPLARDFNDLGRAIERVHAAGRTDGEPRAADAVTCLMARMDLLQGDPSSALERLRQVDELPPRSQLDRAWARARLGQVDLAESDLGEALGALTRYPSPTSDLRAEAARLGALLDGSIAPGPHAADPTRFVVYGGVAVVDGPLRDAVDELDGVLEHAHHTALTVPEGDSHWVATQRLCAQLAAGRGRTEEAIGHLDAVIAVDPAPDVLAERAWQRLLLGDPDGAAIDLDAALQSLDSVGATTDTVPTIAGLMALLAR